MVEMGAIKLQDFLLREINVVCQATFHVDRTHLKSPDLPFDIHVYKTVNPAHTLPTDKKAIYLSEGQIQHQFKKISMRIKALAGHANPIYARQTVVSRVDKNASLDFLKDHHLQVALPGKYRYGLYEKGELVSVAIFSGGRLMREKRQQHRSFELLRFCHKSDSLVIGGLSKLLKRFIQEFAPHDIMTYVDRDWSQHSSLLKLGFQEEGVVPGITIWVSGNRQIYVPNEKDLDQIKNTHPIGYRIDSAGSIKMLKYLSKQV